MSSKSKPGTWWCYQCNAVEKEGPFCPGCGTLAIPTSEEEVAQLEREAVRLTVPNPEGSGA